MQYNYSHLSFLSEVSSTSKSVRIINLKGQTTYIITEPSCVIRERGHILEIQQSVKSEIIKLDFQSPTSAIEAHKRLRTALLQLKNNLNPSGSYNNKVTVINTTDIGSELLNGDINETNVICGINNYFTNLVLPTIVVDAGETLIFNIPINYYDDDNDITTFKFAQIRKYIFKLGNGVYPPSSININNLELIEVDKGLKFIDLYDIELANKSGAILTVNSTGDGIEYESLAEIASRGFRTEYMIDLMDSDIIKIKMNSEKLIIHSIDKIDGDISNLLLNGCVNNLPTPSQSTTIQPFNDLEFRSDIPCMFNMVITKFLI